MTQPAITPFPDPDPLSKLRDRISGLYRPSRRWNIMELDLLRHTLSHREADGEVDDVVNYFQSLTPAEKKYFPQSAQRLLEQWSQILDRAALAKQVGPAMVTPNMQAALWKTELNRVEDALKKLRGSKMTDGVWDDVASRNEANQLKAARFQLLANLGWRA